jgi:hypothetical protein
MASKYTLEWIDKEAKAGPLFRINRDVYSRDRENERVIRLNAVESYSPAGVEPAVEGFYEVAKTWGAPIVFIIQPNLAKPPAGRFLFEWSRQAFENRSVEMSFMRTNNRLSQWMGRVVLRTFTDTGMPFEALRGEDALQARLSKLDLSCPKEDFQVAEKTTALVRYQGAPTLLGSIMSRIKRRLTGRR